MLTVALCRDLTRTTVSDSKTELLHITFPAIISEIIKRDCEVQWITQHFHVSHYYKSFCCIRYTARMKSAYFRISTLQTHTKHVCDYITPNYTSMTHRVGIYQRTDALYGDLTHITVSDVKSECISHNDSSNNNRKNDTGLSGTMKYDIFSRITRLHKVLLHSIHCKDEFCTLQYINFVYTNKQRL